MSQHTAITELDVGGLPQETHNDLQQLKIKR